MDDESQIIVLMTCYNRRETTLRCLASLYSQKLPGGASFQVFLVDDGCTDGTGAAVKAAYPDVTVIQGTGDLFWCNGMRLAWEHAAQEDPDFYLWLNDDVELRPDAIQRLLSCWSLVAEGKLDGRSSDVANQSSDLRSPSSNDYSGAVIVVGSTCDPETGEFTYGGQRKIGKHPSKFVPVPPKDQTVECDVFQGNIVLVPRAVYEKIGNMNPFSHAMGDTDYGLRAKTAGCRVVVAPGFVASCEKNRKVALHDIGFKNSWSVLMRRLPPMDYLRFLQAHVGMRWPLYWFRPYVKLLWSGIRRRG